jgi:hypothetical protein
MHGDIPEKIFKVISPFCTDSTGIVKYKAFEAMGYIWVKYPHILQRSTDIIHNVFKSSISTEDEKLLILKTFNNFFSMINSKMNEESNDDIDLGSVHLFFEGFINNILDFLIIENSQIVRLQAINLIKLILDLGNITIYNIQPYIFSSLFDYNSDIRFHAVTVIEKIIKNSKDKFLSNIKECLKNAFKFQKNIYTEHKLLNSQVKQLSGNEYIIVNENIFELLNYKISKLFKDNTLNKKILVKFIQTFQDYTMIESEFSDCITRGIEKFEFFEWVGILIGDYKYHSNSELHGVFYSLYKDYDTDYLVFQHKLNEMKENKKIDYKLVYLFLISTLRSALFKFLLCKYQNTLFIEDMIIKNMVESKSDSEEYNMNTVVEKEMFNFRFYEFYSAFSTYYKKAFSLINGKKINQLIEHFRKIKFFNKLKKEEIRGIILKYRKKKNKLSDTDLDEFLYSRLFPESVEKRIEKTTIACKARKRITLEEDEYKSKTAIKKKKK